MKAQFEVKFILLIFLCMFTAVCNVDAAVIKKSGEVTSETSRMYLTWNNDPKRDSVLNEISGGTLNHTGDEYPKDTYIKYLKQVESLPRFTEENTMNFRFLFGDTLHTDGKRKRVAAIVFQGANVQQELMDEITYITLDKDFRANVYADLMPVYIGGYDAMIHFLNEELSFPHKGITRDMKGEVLLGFIVNKDGSIGKVKILESGNDTLDREAYHLTKSMPKWSPGIKRRPVPVFVMMQFIFRP